MNNKSVNILNKFIGDDNKSTNEITLLVTNNSNYDIKDFLIKVPIQNISKKYPDFRAEYCIVMEANQEIPSQVIDDDDDNKADYIVFAVTINKKEVIEYQFFQTSLINKERNYPKRTQAELSCKFGGRFEKRKDDSEKYEYVGGEFKNVNFLKVPPEHTDHSWYIRYEGPGWESDKVGYRFYLDWRNAIDIFGKCTNEMILHKVGLNDFESYHKMNNWGMDIFKVGNSLGIGSIAMWDNNKTVKISSADSTICYIKDNGVLYSSIETKFYGWKVENSKYDVVSKLSINAGSRITTHVVSVNNNNILLCTGFIRDTNADTIVIKTDKKWSCIASWGKQSLNDDNLGIAVFYMNKECLKITSDELNYIVVLKPNNGSTEYKFLAAWEKEPNGIKNKSEFIEFLQKELELLNNPCEIYIK